MGKLNYTDEYPEVAPKVRLLTENGRFEINEEIKLDLFETKDRNKLTLRNIMKEIIKLFLKDRDSNKKSRKNKLGIATLSEKILIKNAKFVQIFGPSIEYIIVDRRDIQFDVDEYEGESSEENEQIQ